MPLFPFTASVDLGGLGKGKRLASWHLSQGTGAQTVNFRSGGASGPIQFQVQLPATSSKDQTYSVPAGCPLFATGLYVEVVGTGFAQGCVDLI